MFIRTAAFGYFIDKQRRSRKDNFDLRRDKYEYLKEHTQAFKDLFKYEDKLLYQTYPRAMWFFGTLAILVGLFVLFVIFFQKDWIFHEKLSIWSWTWRILICVLLVAFGVTTLYLAEIQRVGILQDQQAIVLERKNIFNSILKFEYRFIENIQNIQVEKRGHDSRNHFSIHFQIIINFKNERQLQLLECDDLSKVKKKYCEVMSFLGLQFEYDQIQIIDQSTNNNTIRKRESKKQHPVFEEEPDGNDTRHQSTLILKDQSNQSESSQLIIDNVQISSDSTSFKLDDTNEVRQRQNQNDDQNSYSEFQDVQIFSK